MTDRLYDWDLIASLCDGERTSKEVASLVGCSAKYVQNVMKKLNLPRRPQGAPTGQLNGAFVCNRMIQRDGYALVSGYGHPDARRAGTILEHRLVMEHKLGRRLLKTEVVDHIDGLVLHNHPDNLRLFDSNASHLSVTLLGNVPNWSFQGLCALRAARGRSSNLVPVDMYHQRKARGDVRLLQILLAWSALGRGNQYLLGTHRHLEKAGIDHSSDYSLAQALESLYSRW